MSSQIKLGLVQLNSSADVKDNFEQIKRFVGDASSRGADLVVLPESCLLMEQTSGQKLALLTGANSEFYKEKLASLAAEYNIFLVAGTIPIDSSQADRPYARCHAFNNNGKVVTKYDKVHLFDVAINKQESYKESNSTQAGNHLAYFNLKGFKFGLSVCYDLRFPEMYRLYQQQNVDVLLVPSAFTHNTGLAHWELLLRARAVENQCFVVAANQCGRHANGRRTYGHSMAIGPWGEIIGELEEKPGVLLVDLQLAEIKNLNKNFPVHNHRVF